MRKTIKRHFYLFIVLLFCTYDAKSQNEYYEIEYADSSVYYNNFFIHGWLLFHKQYHRQENNIVIDSIQFFNIPDTTILDGRDLTKTYLNKDNSIDSIEYLIYDNLNDSLIYNIDYIPYFKSDSLIRFNVLNFDTMINFTDRYYLNKYNFLKRDISFNLNKDTLEDFEYFYNGNKPYLMRWIHFNELTKTGIRLYEEKYYYIGDYIEYRIRNIFSENQAILMSYKDIRCRDANNRLILEKYHTFDSTVMDYVQDGYRIVYGAPLISDVKIVSGKKNNSLSSTGKIISWSPDLDVQKQLRILKTDGAILFETKLAALQSNLVWPNSLSPGAYLVQILGTKSSISKILIKLH